MRRNQIVFWIVIVFLFLFVVVSSLKVPLVVNAAKYAEVSREMVSNHDWINLTIASDAYGQKPPLLFWIGAASYSLFGFSVIGYKIAVIICSLLGFYSIYRLGKLLYGTVTAQLAMVFWGTSLAYLHFNNDIHTDTLLASFVVFSVWQFLAYLKFRKWHQFFWGSVGVGLSMLTKGPVGALIPVVVVGVELLVQRQWKDIFHWRWLLTVLIVGVVISPALIGLLHQFGMEGIKFYFWTNNVGRVTGSYKGSGADYTFYLHTSLYLLLPWSIFLMVAFFKEIQQVIQTRLRKGEKNDLSVLAGVLVFCGILSVAQQQNPHYILSAVPLMLLLTAKWTVVLFNGQNSGRFQKVIEGIHKFVALAVVMFLLLITLYVYPEKRLFYWLVYGLLGAGVLYFVFQRLSLRKQILMLVLASSALMFTVNVSMYPSMMQYHTSYDAAKVFNEQAPESATLSIYKNNARYWNIFLYSKSPGRYIITPDDLGYFSGKQGDWIYTSEEGYQEIEQFGLKTKIMKVYEQHRSITGQSIRFLNPKTRASRYREMYLLELQ